MPVLMTIDKVGLRPTWQLGRLQAIHHWLLTRRLFGAMLQRIWALSVPTG